MPYLSDYLPNDDDGLEGRYREGLGDDREYPVDPPLARPWLSLRGRTVDSSFVVDTASKLHQEQSRDDDYHGDNSASNRRCRPACRPLALVAAVPQPGCVRVCAHRTCC